MRFVLDPLCVLVHPHVVENMLQNVHYVMKQTFTGTHFLKNNANHVPGFQHLK